jgi:hypothetical protein
MREKRGGVNSRRCGADTGECVTAGRARASVWVVARVILGWRGRNAFANMLVIAARARMRLLYSRFHLWDGSEQEPHLLPKAERLEPQRLA